MLRRRRARSHRWGTYEADGDSITFGSIGSTLIGCDEVIAGQEQVFFQALGPATGYSIIVERPELLDANGELLVAFRRTEPA